MLAARYKYLDDIAADADEFQLAHLNNASTEERREALKSTYDHMRKGLAVDCAALNRLKLEELVGKTQPHQVTMERR